MLYVNNVLKVNLQWTLMALSIMSSVIVHSMENQLSSEMIELTG